MLHVLKLVLYSILHGKIPSNEWSAPIMSQREAFLCGGEDFTPSVRSPTCGTFLLKEGRVDALVCLIVCHWKYVYPFADFFLFRAPHRKRHSLSQFFLFVANNKVV
jgi:hypothetical protein